jgi:hypothetical protein
MFEIVTVPTKNKRVESGDDESGEIACNLERLPTTRRHVEDLYNFSYILLDVFSSCPRRPISKNTYMKSKMNLV